MFEILGPIFEQNANINFEPILEKGVNSGPIFKKMQISVVSRLKTTNKAFRFGSG